jgi:hypothetical protein
MPTRLHVQNPYGNREIRYPAASSDEAGIRPSVDSHDHLYSADQAFYRNAIMHTAGAWCETDCDDAQVIRVGAESRQWPIVR